MLPSDVDRHGSPKPARSARLTWLSRLPHARRDVAGALLGTVTLAAAFLVPHLHDATVTP